MSVSESTWAIQKPNKSMHNAHDHSNFSNLVGMISGEQVVIGFLGCGRWQLRCKCGLYSSRKTTQLVSGGGYEVCHSCRDNLIKLRSGSNSGLSVNQFIRKYHDNNT